jgi:hypothetical protein
MKSDEAEEWEKAIEEEYNGLWERGTFVHVGWDDVPKNETVMNSSLVLTKKFDESGKLERFKARCCARGDQLTAGIDYHETFFPTLRNETLSIMLSIIAAEEFETSQIDVKQAYLYSTLKRKINAYP